MKPWKCLLGVVALFIAGSTYTVPAMAAQIKCDSPKVTFLLSSATQKACFSGNDTNQVGPGFAVFGFDDWILADKSDDTTSGDQVIHFTDAGMLSENWAIDSLPSGLGFGDIFVTLKQAKSFAAFLIDATSGTWGTNGPGKSANGLSHASIYYRNLGSTSVPGPGAAGLFLLGLTLLGSAVLLRRRSS